MTIQGRPDNKEKAPDFRGFSVSVDSRNSEISS